MSASTIKAFTEGLPEDIKSDSSTFGQSVIDEFSVLRTLLPSLHPSLVEQLQDMYPHLIQALQCPFSVVRFAAARCFAGLCKADITSGIRFMVESVIPMVSDQHNLQRRQGGVECIYRKSR